MKEILKAIFTAVCIIIFMTACDGKNEKMPPNGGLDKAEQLAMGVYVGEWSRTNLSTNVVETGTGSIEFSVDSELGNNVSVMTLKSEGIELGVNADQSVCNISRLSSGVLTYWNVSGSNPFGMTFQGTISPEGVATMVYNKIVRSGRREVEFSYTFSGTKQ